MYLRSKTICVSALSFLLALPVAAQDLVMGYDGFFNRIKTSKKNEYTNSQLGIFLVNTKTAKHCHIETAAIDFEGAITTVDIGADNQLLLPYNKQLRDDKAKLKVTVSDQSQCNLAFQIMTVDNNIREIKTPQVMSQIVEFEKMLGDMAGYFGRMNLPATVGLQFIFEKTTSVYKDSGELFKSGNRVTISQDEIINGKIAGLSFKTPPLRIIPLTEKI